MKNVVTLTFVIVMIINFFYGLKSSKNAIKSFLYAIGANVFLLLPFGYLGNDYMRILRIPVGYLPFIGSIFSFIFLSRFSLKKNYYFIFILTLIFWIYLIIQSLFLVVDYISFAQYFFMWVLNIYAMLCIANIVSRVDSEFILDFLRKMVIVIMFSCMIGIIKYLIGITSDANFMPLMNRNGTVFLVVMTMPLLFMLRDIKLVSFPLFTFSLLSYCLGIVLMQSRMGLVGALCAVLFYYIFMHKINLFKITMRLLIFCLLIIPLLISPVGDKLQQRLERAEITISKLMTGQEFENYEGDYARVQLLRYGIELIKENPLFGTGVGLENYRAKLRNLNPIRESKPHNFYISYLAEFGIFGFSFLMFILFGVWRKMSFLGGGTYAIIGSAFKAIFLSVMIMLTMNEYITFPVTWIIWGIGMGLSARSYKEVLLQKKISFA